MAAGIILRHAPAAATMSQTHSTKYNMSWASKTVVIMCSHGILPWTQPCHGHSLAAAAVVPWPLSCCGRSSALAAVMPWPHSCRGCSHALATVMPWLQ